MAGGRPKKYNADIHCKFAKSLVVQGLTDDQIADAMGITRSTYYKWRTDHKEFSDTIKNSKIDPDDAVEASLYKRALGLTVKEVKNDGDREVVTHKEIPPDTAAAFIWLKNRRPKKWRNDPENEKQAIPDADLTAFRINRRAFDIQQEVLASKSKNIGLMCGRRAGKSETNKLLAINEALSKPDAKILMIGLTIKKTLGIYDNDMRKILTELGVEFKASAVESKIEVGGSLIQFGGNSSVTEREKYRGQWWDLIIIDEAQSQHDLKMFIDEIIEPMLLDRNGRLVLSGSGPRIRNSYWETFYTQPPKGGRRWNWSLEDNPHIHNHLKVLAEIREKKNLSETSPLYVREYLGQISYDDDALVYRLADQNYYTDQELEAWIKSQPVTDVRFTAGLDYGWTDSDGFVIIAYSVSRPESFIIYEHKANRASISDLRDKINEGIEYIKTTPMFFPLVNKDFYIYADTNEGKVSFELATKYGLPILDAYKANKKMAIEMLQEEVRTGQLKTRRGSVFEAESLQTVFARDEQDNLTREIDDSAYHPDLLDAVLYSKRPIWMFQRGEA